MEDSERTAQLLGPVQIRQLGTELDISPTKKLGQNFLHDPNTVRMIVHAADLNPHDHVLEVGPGLGSLTLGLLPKVQKLTAVEIDPRLATKLPSTVADFAPTHSDKLEVITADALHLCSDQVHNPTAFVANLPYNVAVPVVLHVLATYPTVRRVLVMVQAEVAQRLAAQPGSKVYGIPSVKANFYGKVRKAGSIGKKVFWPAPNVDSGLVRIDCFAPGESPWPQDPDFRSLVYRIIDIAFAERRKTLRSVLKKKLSGAHTEALLEASGIAAQARAETLDIQDFIRLAQCFSQLTNTEEAQG